MYQVSVSQLELRSGLQGTWQEKPEQCLAGYTEETCTGEVEIGG